MTYLLDVNLLISLVDPAHVHHNLSHDWFAARGRRSWATCPITENGALRVLGHPKYPNAAGNPGEVLQLLAQLRGLPGHVFWPDEISLFDAKKINPRRLVTSDQVTDTYLLALARSKNGQLATLDRRMAPDAVPDGPQHLHIIF